MTCWSCTHYRQHGCYYRLDRWPDIGQECPGFIYEPGSDEAERIVH